MSLPHFVIEGIIHEPCVKAQQIGF